MSGKPRILFVTDSRTPALPVPDDLANAFEIVQVESPLQAISQLSAEPAAGILIDSAHLRDAQSIERILGNERILEAIPDGVALLDLENRIVWANERFCKWAESEDGYPAERTKATAEWMRDVARRPADGAPLFAGSSWAAVDALLGAQPFMPLEHPARLGWVWMLSLAADPRSIVKVLPPLLPLLQFQLLLL